MDVFELPALRFVLVLLASCHGYKVGKVSVEWLAGEKTKVVGTFPPKKMGWTGYVEKDTVVSSSDGAENTAAVAADITLISIAAASSVLLQVGKNASQKKFQYPLLYIIVIVVSSYEIIHLMDMNGKK
ncbi:hypothetical protein Q3G72_032193 [Acer saccharum]|nr:hypothetical protein Q3G72_032193 [Acer saccharum]